MFLTFNLFIIKITKQQLTVNIFLQTGVQLQPEINTDSFYIKNIQFSKINQINP